ncbi:SHOCT domain-containing protein [Natrarchaeobius halalkaliphilus]|uniref:SHOCT domain-containing protein n=1 Tax=Natrarchaeobius halalkaliphilus TaxID=1679091 RepID=A0A3N6NV30_9EURY|nr:SHOCT domain-containing protein [Natrarchaeobius halalkaliphilus]RQG87120.1 SHOCT domain-containing protein [Natrarchaeobius halalkaliphilus]
MNDDPATRFRENITEITAMIVTGLWLVGLFTNQWWWLPLLLVGYIVVVPLVALLFGDESDREEWWDWWDDDSEDESWESETDSGEDDESVDASSSTNRVDSNADALETLRDRYAAGELTDAQFEQKLERLLETETLEDADRWRRDAREDRTHRQFRDSNEDSNLEYET